MKSINILLLAICPTLLLSSCKNNRTYDYEFLGLNRIVKSVKVTTYKAESKFGEVVKGDLYWDGHYLAIFNSIGNLESISSFDDNGELTRVEKYKYDKDNKIIEVSSYDKDGDIGNKLTYTYINDQIESFTQKSYWNDTENINEYKYKWDGEQLLERMRISNGELSTITKYKRNGKDGSEWITYDQDGKEISRGDETYNDYGRLVSRNEGELHIEIKWNDKKLPIFLKNAHLSNNTIISWFVDGVKDTYYYVEYEYDKKGNWINQIIYEGESKKPLTISERIITY